jgi:hypothetical protein
MSYKKVGYNNVIWRKIYLLLVDKVKLFYIGNAYSFFSLRKNLFLLKINY